MVKRLASGIRIIVLLVLLALAYLAIWLQGATRDINWARGMVLEALNPPDAPYAITVGDMTLSWKSLTELPDVRVSNLQMARKDGGIFATMDDVNLTVDPLGFVPGHRLIDGLRIDQPRLYLVRDEAGVLRLGLEGMPETLAVNEVTGFFASDDKKTESTRSRVPFGELEINDAKLLFTDAATGATLSSEHFYFNIGRDGHDLHGSLAMPFRYRDKPGSIDASVMTQTLTGTRNLNARLQDAPYELVCMLAPCPADIQFDGAVSGKIFLRKSPLKPIEGGSIALTTEKAKLTAPQVFAEPITIKSGQFVATASNEFSLIRISQADFDVKDTKLHATAAIAHKADGWYADGEASCARLNINKLYKYWPLPLASESREWVTTQLSGGYAQSGKIAFNITPADMGDVMRDEAISATAIARDMNVDYLPGFPRISAANGTAHFTGKRITVDIDSGKLLNATTLKPSKLAFTNLDIPATPMETTLNLDTSASDVATILKLPPFTFDDSVNLDPATIKGSASATIKLAFDAFSKDKEGGNGQVDFSGIDYDVEGTLTNISQPKLVGTRDVSNFSGTVKASPQGAELAGTVTLEGSTVNLTLKDGPGSDDTTVSANGTLATAQFEKFGVPTIEQLGAGSVGIDVMLKLGATAQTLERGTIDLTGVPVAIKEISWKKPLGTKATLDVVPGNAANRYGLKLAAPGLSLGNASITFTPAMDDIVALSLPAVKTDVNDFALNYAVKEGGYVVSVKGNALDISDSYDDDSEPATLPPDEKDKEKLAEKPLENSILADFPALDLDIDLGKMVLVKEYPFTQVKGALRCDKLRCNSARFTAKNGDGDLNASIGFANGKRQLLITNSNAGAFLRAVDVSDRVYNGELHIDASYDDIKTPAPLVGRLHISKFKLKNSEILARIISIGSLSGLANVLTGEGIDFDGFKSDIGALAGVVNVTKGRAESNALGLTVEGSVDTNASFLDLKGVVVPANSLNSLFGKLPIIGALAGGEGEGLIAFNYSVKGPMADPKVFVNPLSGLTPGFLRGIFTAGDKKVETVPNQAAEKPTVPAEEVPQQPVPWPSEKGKRSTSGN